MINAQDVINEGELFLVLMKKMKLIGYAINVTRRWGGQSEKK